MPTGLKQSSSVVSIGFSATEAVAGTIAQASVDLNLSPLDREVFVVLAVNLDADFPDALPATNTLVSAAMTTTRATIMPTLANSNCLSVVNQGYRGAGLVDSGVAFTSQALETPPSTLEYIGVIATNDFFVQVQGANNAGLHDMSGKIYGYRATESADVFAALVQSEVLSA